MLEYSGWGGGETLVCCFTHPCIHWIFVGALTGDRTGNLGVLRLRSSQLRHPARAQKELFNCPCPCYLDIFGFFFKAFYTINFITWEEIGSGSVVSVLSFLQVIFHWVRKKPEWILHFSVFLSWWLSSGNLPEERAALLFVPSLPTPPSPPTPHTHTWSAIIPHRFWLPRKLRLPSPTARLRATVAQPQRESWKKPASLKT